MFLLPSFSGTISAALAPKAFPCGFTSARAPAREGNSCCAHPAEWKERGQGEGAHAIPLTVVPRCVVPTAQTLPSVGAAVVSVAIAVAGLAAGEAPEARQAAVTLPPVHPGEAVALARLCVAEGVVRASDVALTGCKKRGRGAVFPWQTLPTEPQLLRSPEPRVQHTSASARPEPEGARGTSVALSSNNVGTTLALSSTGVTH